jgi:RNA polymerase sigma-70 factor (ECF subfamily)
MSEERELVQRVKAGDQVAFRELVERFKQQTYYLALDLAGNHHDAEDISQEVFMKAYRGIGKFRSGSKLSTWLYRITVNAYIDSKRRKSHKMVSLFEKRDETEVDPLEVVTDEVTGNPELSMNAADLNEHISNALEHLSERERSVFVLRHYHDLPLKEISKALEITEGTVKSLLFRSIQKLRVRLSFFREELGMEDRI